MSDDWKRLGETQVIRELADINAFNIEQRAKGYAVKSKFDGKSLRDWVAAQTQIENQYLKIKKAG